ncbi:MAG TPA: hypothetical protein V6C85_24475 [Allocoleopsis sp.]
MTTTVKAAIANLPDDVPTLQLGASGLSVAILQQLLNLTVSYLSSLPFLGEVAETLIMN